MLRLYNAETLPGLAECRTYRSNTWVGLLTVTLMMAGMTAFVAIPKTSSFSLVYLFFPALLTLIFLCLTIAHFRLCRKPGNWLLKEHPDGLFINLRSFRNHQYPEDSRMFLFVPKEAVAGVGKTLEKRMLPHHWMREKSQFAYIDLYLKEGVETGSLANVLHAERRCTPHGVTARHSVGDCPVRLADAGVIRLVWEWVEPREDKALLLLGENYSIAPERLVKTSNWETLSTADKDILIDQLWEWGQEDRAYMLAAQLYGLRENKAKQLVERRNRARSYE